jgi:hypothetical protein
VSAWFPRESVAVAVTIHLPSARSGRSQPAVPTAATYVHVKVTAPFVAVMMTVAPGSTPGISTNGVESAVTSSVEDAPVSDDDARSALEGRPGAVVSIVRVIDGPADDTFPAASVIVPDTVHTPSDSTGRSHDTAEPTT